MSTLLACYLTAVLLLWVPVIVDTIKHERGKK